MPRTLWATHLWPGLPSLLGRGSWRGLALALGFAGLVSLGLAAGLVWSELLPPAARMGVWLAVVGWSVGAMVFRRPEAQTPSLAAADIFPTALDQYLKGNGFEAERLLVALLRQTPRDVEARLLLATLCRHAGRLDEARCHLDRLEGMESARRWTWEVLRERQRLDQRQQDQAGEESEPAQNRLAQAA